MSEPILKARGLVKTYSNGVQDTVVLRGVDLDIGRGEVVAIIGPSGAGKTTLLYLLGGLAKPTEGRVLLKDQDLYAKDDAQLSRIRNQKIGFVFQFHHLLPELNAVENVALPLMISGKGASAARKAARQLLVEVGLSHRLEHKPGELSGGEQQRVAIARALSLSPEIIMADEPTGNLDKATASSIHDLLLESSRARGQALVLVTHNEALSQKARRIIHMEDGKIVRES
jgi:lipoprotein-releasing system ATP-binding protein